MSELPRERMDTMERLLAGELSAEEQRRLAQQALDDPDLFDRLTAAAAVASTHHHDRARQAPVAFRRPTRGGGFQRAAVAVAALAAMIVLTIAYRSRTAVTQPPRSESASLPTPQANPASPTTSPTRAVAEPILLTAYAGGGERPPAAFRADQSARRVPKSDGVVASENAGVVEIDLGSLDGVAQGVALMVTRGEKDVEVGRITVTTVFRERSRGRTADAGAIHPGDQVRVPLDAHVSALLNQITARRATGEMDDARTLAERAVSDAQNPRVSADLRAQALNELGALQIERSEYDAAERTLKTALPQAGDVARMRVTSNLGALAALRGDRAGAEVLYRQARSLADASGREAERSAIDKNLDALAQGR